LLKAGNGAPTQSNLKRAQSTIYYAVFHCLARDAADMLIGSKGANRSQKAWTQVYRALQHNKAWERCKKVVDLTFPDSVKDFAAAFRILQHKRHRADYDPDSRLTKQEVAIDIEYARQIIADYKAESIKHRRAFGAFVLLERRSDAIP
jgi:uncharacterized protein (UPF0332 family)